jgi:hypothetical protein
MRSNLIGIRLLDMFISFVEHIFFLVLQENPDHELGRLR